MKYNHTNRISLPCYGYAFRTWPLYEWSVKVSTTQSAVEISRKPHHPTPPPFPRHAYTEIIQSYCHLEHSNPANFSLNEYLVLNF